VLILHDQIPRLARRCAEVAPAAAVDVLLAAAERELRAGFRYAVRASEIPVEWWANPALVERVARWASNQTFHVEARTHLLQLMALRAPQAGRAIALAWSELPEDGSETTSALRRAGLSCRLVLDPGGALPLIERAFRQRGDHALEELSSLHSWHTGLHGELRADLSSWPVERLEALGRLLLGAYPIGSDPDRQHRIIHVTAETELRETRDRLISLLLQRESPDARAALDRLADRDAGLQERLRDYRARLEAQALLGVLPAETASEPSSIPFGEAIRLLDQANYRLLRSSGDLLEAVCEVLRLVEGDVASDLAMLYGKPPREKDVMREHLHEDALQAYLRCRLSDLLPSRVLDPKVAPLILREDQGRYRRRVDLRVLALCFQSQDTATVIIEVKWSDNQETEASLVDQLGRKYLIGERLTHGVYLVGWCGEWHQHGRGWLTDRTELEAYLTKQNEDFRASEAGRSLVIRPVVLGLGWRDPEDGD
jgi:hypothetical protein